jgi:hypothetical protein
VPEVQEAAVLDLIRYHRGLTVGKGLASRSPSVYLRTKDRSIVEVCEWESTTSIADASHDPMVSKLHITHAWASMVMGPSRHSLCGCIDMIIDVMCQIGGEAWKAFENACDMLTLSRLPESQQTFPTFQHMDVITTTGEAITLNFSKACYLKCDCADMTRVYGQACRASRTAATPCVCTRCTPTR